MISRLYSSACVFLLIACGSAGKNAETVSLPDRFAAYYNEKKYDSIFYLFSQKMKASLPLNETRDFFSQLQQDAGRLEKYPFVNRNKTFVRHRAEFTNAVFWMDISQNQYGKIDGLLFTAYDGPADTGAFVRNKSILSLPFKDEWFVFWGGDTKEQNYHVSSKSQRHAFDWVIMDSSNKTYRTNGNDNEDYYAFGQPLYAPCDAEVAAVIDGVKDNIPGEMNPTQLTGNTVVLKTADEYILLAHLKMNSIKVKPGDKIKKGQLLGLCGNSGNSSEAHLHFHIQNQEKMEGASGFKCFFEKILVNGVLKTEYSPVKGERIRNAG